MKKTSILALLLASIFACDKVEEPFEKKDIVIPTDGLIFDTTYGEYNQAKRILVLEEFTGYRCANCPAGTLLAQQLKQTYADQLLLLSFHASTEFAAPLNNPDGSFTTDFRTTEGEEYLSSFEVESFPAGMVSRLFQDNKFVVGKDEWEGRITPIKDLAPKYQIEFMNLYNDSLGYIKTKIQIERNSGISENVKLLVYLAEDHIIDWQIDGANTLNNYEHNHVFRGSLNGTWGSDLTFTNDTTSVTFEKLLNPSWNVNNLELTVLLYDATTKEVWQANAGRVK